MQNDRSIPGGTLELSGRRSVGACSGSIGVAGTEFDLTQGSGSSPSNPFYISPPGIQNDWTENGGVRYALRWGKMKIVSGFIMMTMSCRLTIH